MHIARSTSGFFDPTWLRSLAQDNAPEVAVDRIIEIEERFMCGSPLTVSSTLMKLLLGSNTVWTRENLTHSISSGFGQIFNELDEILPASFRERMTGLIVDVGANEGHWSMYMPRRCPDAAMLAIEPNQVPRELLHMNLESNGMQDIAVLPFAISNVAGDREFETIDNVTSLGSFEIDRTGRPWLTDGRIKKERVTCLTLDGLQQVVDAKVVDLLKVDVEGAELDVIAGATTILQKVQRIEIEYGNNHNRRTLIKLLASRGFKLLLDYSYEEGRGDLFFSKTASQ